VNSQKYFRSQIQKRKRDCQLIVGWGVGASAGGSKVFEIEPSLPISIDVVG
jgi:hypothetical protein